MDRLDLSVRCVLQLRARILSHEQLTLASWICVASYSRSRVRACEAAGVERVNEHVGELNRRFSQHDRQQEGQSCCHALLLLASICAKIVLQSIYIVYRDIM